LITNPLVGRPVEVIHTNNGDVITAGCDLIGDCALSRASTTIDRNEEGRVPVSELLK
jgi:hypothetical protein